MKTIFVLTLAIVCAGTLPTPALAADCPDKAQLQQAIETIADKVAGQAAAMMAGSQEQLEALKRSERVVNALLEYKQKCVPPSTDWQQALSGQAPPADSLQIFQRYISALVASSGAVARMQGGRTTMQEAMQEMRKHVTQLVILQKRSGAGNVWNRNGQLHGLLDTAQSAADRLMDDPVVDPEQLFAFGKAINSLEEEVSAVPEDFSIRRWGAHATALTQHADEIRRSSTRIQLAAGSLLSNVQSLVVAKRATIEIGKLETPTIAELRNLLK